MRVEVDLFLVFHGNCLEAMRFYEKVFKIDPSAVQVYTFGDLAEGPRYGNTNEDVMFGELSIYGQRILFGDGSKIYDSGHETGNNFMISVAISDRDEVERVYHELSEDGTIIHELDPTKLVEELALLRDKFGVIWQLSLSPKGPKAF